MRLVNTVFALLLALPTLGFTQTLQIGPEFNDSGITSIAKISEGMAEDLNLILEDYNRTLSLIQSNTTPAAFQTICRNDDGNYLVEAHAKARDLYSGFMLLLNVGLYLEELQISDGIPSDDGRRAAVRSYNQLLESSVYSLDLTDNLLQLYALAKSASHFCRGPNAKIYTSSALSTDRGFDAVSRGNVEELKSTVSEINRIANLVQNNLHDNLDNSTEVHTRYMISLLKDYDVSIVSLLSALVNTVSVER